MELSFTSLFVLVYSRSACKSSRRYVRIQTVLVSGADCLSAAAKHVLNVKCLGNTMRCWDYTEVFGMPPSCAHAKGKACCKLFRHQADSSSLSPTHIEVSVCARISLCILGLADVLSNTSVCRYATEQHEMCGKECREAAQPARAIHHWSIAIAVWCMSVGINL